MLIAVIIIALVLGGVVLYVRAHPAKFAALEAKVQAAEAKGKADVAALEAKLRAEWSKLTGKV